MSVTEDLDTRPFAAGFFQGKIAKGAASIEQYVEVVVPGFDSTLKFQRCRWMPRVSEGFGDPVYPTRDDICLVAQDDRRDWWVIAWWPS